MFPNQLYLIHIYVVQISAALISLTVIFIHTFVALAKGNSTNQNNIYKDLGVSHFVTVYAKFNILKGLKLTENFSPPQ